MAEYNEHEKAVVLDEWTTKRGAVRAANGVER